MKVPHHARMRLHKGIAEKLALPELSVNSSLRCDNCFGILFFVHMILNGNYIITMLCGFFTTNCRCRMACVQFALICRTVVAKKYLIAK